MFCSKCGNRAADGASFCGRCGASLKQNPVVVELDQGSGILSLIPPNIPALWAYYLGIAATVCFLTAVPAFVMGIIGVKYANRHPEAKGKVHAWVGIVLGGLGTVLWTVFLLIIFCGLFYSRHNS